VTTSLRFLGVAGYEIESPAGRILIDPFLRDSPVAPCSPDDLAPPDLILVSHAAGDHLGDTPEIALRTGAPVVCSADVRLILMDRGVPETQIQATVWGVVVEVAGIEVRPVEAHHWSAGTLSDGTPVSGVPLAFIVECEPGVRVYHYGDTAIFDMRLIGELYKPTVGLIGCTVPNELNEGLPSAGRILTGELTPREAAMVVEMLGVNVAIACHYLQRNEDVNEFLRLADSPPGEKQRTVLAPNVGDTILTDGASARIEEAVA
jgi:L-ascorbate metabolism protein UlaG (beta-lactamase superfamily)